MTATCFANDLSPYRDLFDLSWRLLIGHQFQTSNPLNDALRYSMESGGKRVRGVLSLLVAESCGAPMRSGLSGACAVELIHAYSLAHDDLPCMDDDDWRRGRPSLHKMFGESTALLAGDAMLTDSFRVLTDEDFFPDCRFVSETDRVRQVVKLTKAAGSNGMVLGQVFDLYWSNKTEQFSEEVLHQIHLKKTGALLSASCALGAIGAGMPTQIVERYARFGEAIGLAFQAIDDAMDDLPTTGKTAGKDHVQGKLTFLSFYSKKEILEKAAAMTEVSLKNLPFPATPILQKFVESLVFRNR